MMNLTKEQIDRMKHQLAEQRWSDFEQGQPEYNPSFPETPYPSVEALPETDPITNEWNRFYAVPRGHHPNARGGFTTTSDLAMMQFSRSFSEKAYEKAAEPKELYIVPDAEHIDLYDQVNKIPFDKLENFFKDSLE